MHGDSSGDDGDDEYVRNSEQYARLNDRQGIKGKTSRYSGRRKYRK